MGKAGKTHQQADLGLGPLSASNKKPFAQDEPFASWFLLESASNQVLKCSFWWDEGIESLMQVVALTTDSDGKIAWDAVIKHRSARVLAEPCGLELEQCQMLGLPKVISECP